MNVYGRPMKECGRTPITGYNRTGYCSVNSQDQGTHIVCAIVTEEFLAFTKKQGNDLITPTRSFPGLKPGDRWCLCIHRWMEAYRNGAAPKIDLEATSKKVLDYVPKHILL